MLEYSILIIHHGGCPYYLKNYKTLQECIHEVENIVSLEKERGRLYFVDNDFFKNDYQFVGYENIKYLSIKVREVSEWSTYTKDIKLNPKDEKIVNIFNYF